MGGVLLVIMVGSCEKDVIAEAPITLPPTPIISNDQSWAVVIETYLKVTEDMDKNSPVVATLRKGAVLEILSSKSTALLPSSGIRSRAITWKAGWRAFRSSSSRIVSRPKPPASRMTGTTAK